MEANNFGSQRSDQMDMGRVGLGGAVVCGVDFARVTSTEGGFDVDLACVVCGARCYLFRCYAVRCATQ